MRNPRKYIVISILSAVLVALLLFNGGREYWRMAAAAERQNYDYARLGAELYASNCMQCHGPRGEGVVGLPLNRPDLQGDPRDPLNGETYRMLIDTITNGRAGTATTRWVKVETDLGESWLSYSEMPAWSRANGGALDDYQIQALAYFIMMGNQPVDPGNANAVSFWDSIGSNHFPFPDTNPSAADGGVAQTPIEKMPDAAGLTAAENEAAKLLIRDKAKPSCLTCHAIGSYGTLIGPDLTYLGTWGVDEEFLKEWISDPHSVAPERRLPAYWSANRINTGPEPNLESPEPVVGSDYTYMPAFGEQFTEKEMDLLVRYLLGLGVSEQ